MSRIRGKLIPLFVGLVAGALLVAPAGAHFNQNTGHLGKHAWKQVIRERVYTKKQANQRFVRTVASGNISDPVALTAGDCETWTEGGGPIPDWKENDAVVVTFREASSLDLVATGHKIAETAGNLITVKLCNVGSGSINTTVNLDWKLLRG